MAQKTQLIRLASTRFTTATWAENRLYCETNSHTIIYNTPYTIRSKYPADCILFVLEMNNDTNKIEGIGMIRNHPSYETHKVHKSQHYNKHTYIGFYRLDRTQLPPEIIKVVEKLAFKGKSNLKRLAGITIVQKQTEIVVPILGELYKMFIAASEPNTKIATNKL